MADKLFDVIKRDSEKKNSLVCEIVIKCTQAEYDIAVKKANETALGLADLVREYMVRDCSIFEPINNAKKSPKRPKQNENVVESLGANYAV